jgi:hypothetical protein
MAMPSLACAVSLAVSEADWSSSSGEKDDVEIAEQERKKKDEKKEKKEDEKQAEEKEEDGSSEGRRGRKIWPGPSRTFLKAQKPPPKK